MGATAEMQSSKDGRIVAAKASLLELQIWNAASGSKIAVVAPATAISQWALRPDGRVVALVSEGHLSLVDPMSRGAAIKVAVPANVERVDWRADGKVLFATRGQETSVIDAAGNVTATIAAVSSPGGISADGRFLYSREGAMWDVATNQSKWKSQSPAASVAFSDDGQFVALATGQAITGYDSAGGTKRWEVATKGGLGSEIALSLDGQSVAAYDNGESTERGLENRGMALWSRGKRTKLWQSADAIPSVRATFSPDGKVLAFVGPNAELKLADAKTGGRAKQPNRNMGDIRAEPVRWSADGKSLLAPTTNGLAVIDVAKGDRKVVGKAAESSGATATIYHDAVWSPDDGALLVLADQGPRSIATIIDLKTGTPRETLDGKSGSPVPRRFRAAEWNAASGLIALERNDGVALWDGRTKQPARIVDGGDESERLIAFSPPGHLLATIQSPYKEARLWDPKTGTRVRALTVAGSGVGDDGAPETGTIEAMAFSADGARIALKAMLMSGVEQSTHIAIFDTASGALVRTLHSQRHYAYGGSMGRPSLHFTPQGKGLVSIDHFGRVDLWNASNDDPPTTLLEKASAGPSSTLADSGNLLLMGSPSLDIWDLRTRTLTRQLRGDGSAILATRVAKGGGAIAVTRVDHVDLHRFSDRASLALRITPSTATPGVVIVADNGAFAGPSGATTQTAATGPLRVRDGAETEVRSLRANELGALYRPTLAFDFIAGCPVGAP